MGNKINKNATDILNRESSNLLMYIKNSLCKDYKFTDWDVYFEVGVLIEDDSLNRTYYISTNIETDNARYVINRSSLVVKADNIVHLDELLTRFSKEIKDYLLFDMAYGSSLSDRIKLEVLQIYDNKKIYYCNYHTAINKEVNANKKREKYARENG